MTFVTGDRKWGFSRGSFKTLPQRGSRRREADGGRAGSAISGSGRTARARRSGAGPAGQGSSSRAKLEREDGEELLGPRVRQTQRPHANGGGIDLRRIARKMNVEPFSKPRSAGVRTRSGFKLPAIPNHFSPVPSSWPLRLGTAALRVRGVERASLEPVLQAGPRSMRAIITLSSCRSASAR